MSDKSEVHAAGEKDLAAEALLIEMCSGCKYWLEHGADQSGDILGACRRNPPQVYRDDYGDRFPLTWPHDWCGQWEAQKRLPMISCCMGIFEGDQVECELFPDEVFTVRAMTPAIDGTSRFVIEANGRLEVVWATECRRVEPGNERLPRNDTAN